MTRNGKKIEFLIVSFLEIINTENGGIYEQSRLPTWLIGLIEIIDAAIVYLKLDSCVRNTL
jgi:hypothetical protein